MAAYVVTPSGEIIEYRTAHHAVRTPGGRVELYTDEQKSKWVADIPSDWSVGWARPTALGASTDARELKRALRNFDARSGVWQS